MSSFNNVHISNVYMSIEALARYFLAKPDLGPHTRCLLETWIKPRLKEAIHRNRSEAELYNSPVFKDVMTKLAHIEPIVAFEALAGDSRAQDVYYAVAAWKGFSTLPVDADDKYFSEVLDYISARPSEQETVGKKIQEDNADPLIDRKVGLDILHDDRLFQETYGMEREKFKKELDPMGHSISLNLASKTRCSWFTTDHSIEYLRQKYPAHIFISYRIPMDSKYLGADIKRRLMCEKIQSRTDQVEQVLEKYPVRPCVLKRRPKA